jgi:choline dehydrogenase
MQSNLKKLKVGLQYFIFRTGPLTMAAGPAALFVRTRPELASPDVKISVAPFSSDKLQEGLHPWSGFGMTVYQLRPESRGEIRLKSPNPFDPPAMLPNYLATETDRRAIVDGLKVGRRILATPPMQHFITAEYQPGPGVTTDAQLLEHARNTGGTVFHPTSTCKMGVDPMAVVDPELRVHGIEGLRVVDASVMPTVVSGNTNAATIMIGEKAADMVRQGMRLGGDRMAA